VTANRRAGAINLFDALALGIVIGFGAAARALLQPATLAWKIAAFALGCSIPVAAYLAFAISQRARLPRCRNERCSTRTYVVEATMSDDTYYRCACGERYFLTGDELKIVGPGGEPQPFRRRYPSVVGWLPRPNSSRSTTRDAASGRGNRDQRAVSGVTMR
jgi:hypothetical protein